MHVVLLSPLGLLAALGGLLALAGLVLVERRAARIRRELGLAGAGTRVRSELAVALAATAVLLGLAVAQPVLATSQRRNAHRGAEVMFVLDVSRSMAAGPRGGPTRLARAQELAVRLRDALPDAAAGLASVTDRTLPYLFPTTSPQVFAATVAASVRIESPPPAAPPKAGGIATALDAVASIPRSGYFTPGTTRRLVVVLTDGEMARLVKAGLVADAFSADPRVRLIVVRIGGVDDRIRRGGKVDARYVPRATAEHTVASLAAAARGDAFDEHRLGAIAAAARADLAGAPVVSRNDEQSSRPLGAWVAAVALLPLALVVRRRNLYR